VGVRLPPPAPENQRLDTVQPTRGKTSIDGIQFKGWEHNITGANSGCQCSVVLNSMRLPIKPQPNHGIYLDTLRRKSPQQRLAKALELSENVRQLFRQGLRRRFPHFSEEELRQLYLKRLSPCHNRND